MAHPVGSMGQVVIEQEIRDRLGVKPGWQTVQMLVDGHLEIYFIAPEHHRSLLGALKDHIQVPAAPEECWDDLVAEAVGQEFRAKERRS